MTCCPAPRYEAVFNEKRATKDLKRYRKKGPDKTTRLLVDALKAGGVSGATVLDIGGGVGIVHHELLAAGAESAVQVDAAAPYLGVAREEAARRGHEGRVRFVHGDFVAVAPHIATADVVALDRVICCYPDMEQLVATSASRARRLYGAVFPRDRRVLKIFVAVGNLFCRVTRSDFRVYIHSTSAIHGALRREGLALRSVKDTWMWRVVVYERSAAHKLL
jgi:2-polyprenyl-3-methyl-5-hydroxy-6-metoxy-1,4-benzoquinol methylase